MRGLQERIIAQNATHQTTQCKNPDDFNPELNNIFVRGRLVLITFIFKPRISASVNFRQ
jgi:hypothetical protein